MAGQRAVLLEWRLRKCQDLRVREPVVTNSGVCDSWRDVRAQLDLTFAASKKNARMIVSCARVLLEKIDLEAVAHAHCDDRLIGG
jgi:hypothetical protein